ncbi:hypothetical protein [Tychonema sp. LEGE 07199]
MEHRLFTHVTRACQRVIFTSVDLYHFHKKMLQLVEAHFAI